VKRIFHAILSRLCDFVHWLDQFEVILLLAALVLIIFLLWALEITTRTRPLALTWR
jgi:hypothetical protein